MITIYLVRHGQAAKGWDEDVDPGLDAVGREQAKEAAARLSRHGPLPIIASPMRRARQTAQAFELLWDQPARVDPRVVEIPAPGMALIDRGAWMKTLPEKKWCELDEVVLAWRREAIECLSSIAVDTVVVSHSMLINAVVSWVLADERVVCCRPLPASCTTLERSGRSWRLIG